MVRAMVSRRADEPREASLPALLRAARGVFAAGIREALEHAGYDDIPASGLFVIGAIARRPSPLSDVIGLLGVTKQAAGQLVDTMVVRGYLERTVDPEDRRRLTLALSDRGRAAAKIIRTVVERIETDLARRVGDDSLVHTRKTLQALIESDRDRRTQ
jgi:DNA-binding MarR family transcriptional regulator